MKTVYMLIYYAEDICELFNFMLDIKVTSSFFTILSTALNEIWNSLTANTRREKMNFVVDLMPFQHTWPLVSVWVVAGE